MSDDVLKPLLPTLTTGGPRAADAPPDRQAGPTQLVLLLATCCLSVMGAILISPVLPAMEQAFRGTPGVKVLVPVVLTVPALIIGLVAPFAGIIVDKIDRKRAMIVAMVAYSIFGTMPLYLHTLNGIVASRVLVGVCEAVIMTAATTLIADYWDGPRRARYLGLQTTVGSVGAVLFTLVGGLLGANGWRVPFWLYLIAAPLAVPVALKIFHPRPRAVQKTRLAPLPWRILAVPCLVTLFAGVLFFTLIVHLSFVLTDVGVTATATIGLAIAAMSMATAIGSALFGLVARHGPRVLLPLEFSITGVGLAIVALSSSPGPIVVGALIAGFGNGMLLPTLLTWTVGLLTYEQRGRGTGLWTGTQFIGEFFCPLIVAALASGLGGRLHAFDVLAVGAIVVAVLVAVFLRRANAVGEIDIRHL